MLSRRKFNFFSEFRSGIIDCLPLLLAVIPFGAVFGALGRRAGLSILDIMIASGTIFAGASQYAMLELWSQGVSPFLIILTVFAINFRHVLYSASLGRRLIGFSRFQKFISFLLLVDITYAASEFRVRTHILTPTYYITYGVLLYVVWILSNFAGAISGSLIPDPSILGLDFILPLYFLVLVLSFRGASGFLSVAFASAISSILVFLLLGSPWHITLGAFAGLIVAAFRVPSGCDKSRGGTTHV